MDCNTGWLENHGTKLTHKTNIGHHISPSQAAFVGGDPSSKKTGTVQRSDAFLPESKHAPAAIANRSCIMADATVRGINQTLVDHSRAAFSTAEGADSYESDLVATPKGVHPLPPTRMNILTQGEPVDTIRGRLCPLGQS